MTKEELLLQLASLDESELAVAWQAAQALRQARADRFYFLHYLFGETFDIEHWEKTRECVVTIELTELAMNPAHMAHGGVLALLCDNAMGLASYLQANRPGVTVSLSVQYHKPARGTKLIAKATILSAGSRLQAARCDIVDDEGRLVASGTGTFYHQKER